MNQIVPIETAVENIVAPVRANMVELAGGGDIGDRAVSRIKNTLMIALRRDAKLAGCTEDSLQTAVMKCAADGLVPDGKEAVILVYNTKVKTPDGKERWDPIANYQPMVHGIIKRMKELGAVHSIVVDVVREKDKFHANMADLEATVHEYDIFSGDRGEVVGAYCIIRNARSEVVHREIMSRSDLDQVRSASKQPDSDAWKKWQSEMFKKAVLRRASKWVPLDNSRLHEMIERMDAMFEFQEGREVYRENPFQSGGALPAKASASALPAPKEAPEEEAAPLEPVTMADAKAYSDHLWGSKRTPADVKADANQFAAKNNFFARPKDDNMAKRLDRIFAIHSERVVGQDHGAADSVARTRLQKINILDEATEGDNGGCSD